MDKNILIFLKTSLMIAIFCGSALGRAAEPAFPANPDNELSRSSGTFGSSLATSAIRSVLPADEAFSLNALIETPNTLVLIWDIEESYYLYRKSLDFNLVSGDSSPDPEIPDGIKTEDEFFGEVEVYYERLLVRIPFDENDLDNNMLQLEISYQGCAEAGYCYPMQYKALSLEVL